MSFNLVLNTETEGIIPIIKIIEDAVAGALIIELTVGSGFRVVSVAILSSDAGALVPGTGY